MLHLHNGEELHEWSDEEVRVDWQMPPLGMQQAVHTLRALGVRVVGCEQEADALIVAEARRVCAFAVLGRDSDFFVFTGARYVPIDFLSFDGRKAPPPPHHIPESGGPAPGLRAANSPRGAPSTPRAAPCRAAAPLVRG